MHECGVFMTQSMLSLIFTHDQQVYAQETNPRTLVNIACISLFVVVVVDPFWFGKRAQSGSLDPKLFVDSGHFYH